MPLFDRIHCFVNVCMLLFTSNQFSAIFLPLSLKTLKCLGNRSQIRYMREVLCIVSNYINTKTKCNMFAHYKPVQSYNLH